MSYSKECTIWCDGEDCYAWENLGYSAAKKTRRKLKERHGWAHTTGEGPLNADYCPECSE